MSPSAPVNGEGLSRREISWLLAQEAKGAAQALRQGLQDQARDALAPSTTRGEATGVGSPESNPHNAPLLDSLAALDDAVSLLGRLQSNKVSSRRGRLDVAALVYELCPHATLTVATSEGTDVFGDEEHVRRMLQLLLSQATGRSGPQAAGPAVSIHREGDFVHVSADLGPDATDQSALERRWLNRMALRAGGRQIVSGSQQILALPADDAQQEIEALKQELSQAQELGEAYARELAAAFNAAEAHAGSSPFGDEKASEWKGALRVAQALARQRNDASWTHRLTAPLLLPNLEMPLADQPRTSLERLHEFAEQRLGASTSVSLGVRPPHETTTRSLPQASTQAALSWLVLECEGFLPSQPGIDLELTASEHSFEARAQGTMPPGTDLREGVAGALLSTYLAARGGQFQARLGEDGIVRLWVTLPLP